MEKKLKSLCWQIQTEHRHLKIKCSSYREDSKEQYEEIADDFPVFLYTEF